jgi:hypothetical protein
MLPDEPPIRDLQALIDALAVRIDFSSHQF